MVAAGQWHGLWAQGKPHVSMQAVTSAILVQAYNKVANGPLYFGIPLTNIQNSLITLSVKADSLSLVVNASPGKIMFAQVSPAAAAIHTAETGVQEAGAGDMC